MECNFQVGQKVVCVNAYHSNVHDVVELIEGETYEIAWIGWWNWPNYYSGVGVRLKGIERHVGNLNVSDQAMGRIIPFTYRRFKPLEERKTDISIFTKMLSPKKILEDA